MPILSPAPEAVPTPETGKIYHVGTLHYTLRSVLVLFTWLLWGDFAFCFFESIFGKFIPLYLSNLHASNTLIGIMTGSIAGVVNIFFLPSLSHWSDQYRGRWGRRVPFLAMATPITVASMVAMGFAPEIGSLVYSLVMVHIAPTISLTSVILALLCFFVASFHYFNMVLCNAFNWLLRDVVPLEFMARFLSWFRVISTVSGVVFNWYVFPYIISHRKEVCIGIGLFYLIAFMAMCWHVKEGEYPPPRPAHERPGIIKSYALYFRDCFSVPLYRNFFIMIMVGGFVGGAGNFTFLFTTNSLGLDMGDLGKILALGGIVTAVFNPPMGWLCDKFSAIQVAIVAQAGVCTVAILSFFFIHGKESLLVFTLIGAVASVGWGLGIATLSMRLFPVEKFGQLSAGANVFGCGITIVGNFAVGVYMDWMHSNFRMAYLWSALGGLALIPLLAVYRGWKQHGGPDHYVAPMPPE
jgi:MFS family permease